MLQRSIKSGLEVTGQSSKVQLLDKVQDVLTGKQDRRTLLPQPLSQPSPLRNVTGMAQNEDNIAVTGGNG